jgi:SAM-dependent methyltransferase
MTGRHAPPTEMPVHEGVPAPEIDPSNEAQAENWDGVGGDTWVDNADAFDAFVARSTRALMDAADIAVDAQVLDVGCGIGQTTREAARRAPRGSATGVDLSRAMLALAEQRAAVEGLTNVTFTRADAQIAPLGTFDRVISRTGAMFFGDPEAAFTNLRRSLRPGGLFAATVWQPAAENEWFRFLWSVAATDAMPPVLPPFSLGDPDRVRELLAASGFAPPTLTEVRVPMVLGTDLESAERFLVAQRRGDLDQLDRATRARELDRARESMEAHLGPAGVAYGSASWLITAGR